MGRGMAVLNRGMAVLNREVPKKLRLEPRLE